MPCYHHCHRGIDFKDASDIFYLKRSLRRLGHIRAMLNPLGLASRRVELFAEPLTSRICQTFFFIEESWNASALQFAGKTLQYVRHFCSLKKVGTHPRCNLPAGHFNSIFGPLTCDALSLPIVFHFSWNLNIIFMWGRSA